MVSSFMFEAQANADNRKLKAIGYGALQNNRVKRKPNFGDQPANGYKRGCETANDCKRNPGKAVKGVIGPKE